MRLLQVSLLAFIVTIPIEGRFAIASDLTVIQQIIGRLESRHSDCEVDASHFGKLRVQQKSGDTNEIALVWIYAVTGCGGGNNWSSHVSVFSVNGDQIQELGRPLGWSVIKGVDFNDDRALIYAVDQGPNDPHCCPTQGQTVQITVEGRVIKSKVLKTWRPRE
jgi:hypothetical protein